MRRFDKYSNRALQHGMTLIEVLVSLLIFSFGFLGLIGMQARALQVSTDAEDRSRAALLANEIVSTMWTQNTVNLPAATITAWQARVADQSAFGLPASSGAVGLPDAAGMVQVSITWRSPARKSSEASSSYFTQVMLP